MRRNTYYTNNTQYWSDDDFSAEEIFNMFFGSGFTNTTAANRNRGHFNNHHHNNNNSQPNFVYTQSVSSFLLWKLFLKIFFFNKNNYALLFQLMPILLIVLLSLLSSLMVGEPIYSLTRTKFVSFPSSYSHSNHYLFILKVNT